MEFELLHHIAFFAVIIICCGLIYRIENNKNTGYFSIFVFLSIFGITEITTSNNSISIIIPSVIFSLVFYISKNKYKYTRFPLVYNDIFGFDGKIYRDLFRTYSKEMVLFCFYAFISVILVLALFSFSDGSANHPAVLYSSLAINALGAWFSLPYAMAEYRRANWDGRHISTFFATMLAQGFRPADMTRLTISASPATADIENIEKPADRTGFAPHIIMIGAESTFPPRLFGMPEEPNVAEFFDGTDGVRELKVEIFGGQTIQTHTSCLTGLSMQLFGENRAYVPRFWKGRIGVSLPFFLRSHGYCVAAFLGGQRDWMGIGGLYETIGVERVHEASEYTGPHEIDTLYARDSTVYGAALSDIGKRIEKGGKRTCTIIETLRNHGPHNRTLTTEAREISSRQWFAENCTSLSGDVLKQACEWYGRLRASVDDYNDFKARLAAEHPDQTFFIVHYGDHQPTFCADIGGVSSQDLFRTYLTVDWVGQIPASSKRYAHTKLPIYCVDLLVAQTCGLPLDGFLEAKAAMLATDGDCAYDNPEYQGLIASLVRAGKLKPNACRPKVGTGFGTTTCIKTRT